MRVTRAFKRQSGFSLIEVLISLIVLAVGLLGFALMQTMSVRFAQSSNYRTEATNLAYEILDQMRSNRLLAAQYTAASFTAGAGATACPAVVGTITIATSIACWETRVRAILGEAASAQVTYINGVAQVTIVWNDQRWENDNARKTATYETGRIMLRSRI